MSAKTKKGTTPTHAHDTSLTHGGAAEEGPVAGATSATQVLRALAPPPDHRGRGGRQDVTLEPEQFGPGMHWRHAEGYFTFAPTTVSHSFVMVCFAWACCSSVGKIAFA